ncbi:methionine/alanine import family NSS transporter small subunit [Nocardiopsis composta]|uniref:Methionine/alanine importer small subunit n=1 Tax=Nocardiopsis composta TaxID=157465 RepID=A0A7W8VDI1_9ACTN|nr:methionine/alanine import family NSS transporter small subunit [Nocardiopsis composta]MBB5432023.1 hypothetical protein [Nocardiopsis composta]
MSTSSIVMMSSAMVLLWGGLLAAVLWLRAHPDNGDEGAEG